LFNYHKVKDFNVKDYSASHREADDHYNANH